MRAEVGKKVDGMIAFSRNDAQKKLARRARVACANRFYNYIAPLPNSLQSCPHAVCDPCRSGDITFDELTELLDDEHMGRGLDGQRAECVHTPSAVDAACTAVVVPREHFK